MNNQLFAMTKFDIIIFGATGFTGQKVVEELANGGTKYDSISWAVAGRSESKLLNILRDISLKTAVDLSRIKVITADIGDYRSLKIMCSQAQVLLNCCGPYRLYGEPVVRAAVEARTHYIDITGEEDFIGTIQMKYDDKARQAGIYVISACGFDSIPNDLGVVFLEKNFKGTLNSVESYLNFSIPKEESQKSSVFNFGTWESVVYVFLHKQNGKWAVPLLSPDGSIVYHTQRYLYETSNKRPVQFQPYLSLPSIFNVLLLAFIAILVGIFSKFKYGRDLLLNKPEWFSFGWISKQGPTQALMEKTHFTLALIGRGWETGADVETSVPRKTVVAKISATNPAYGFTSLALVQSAVAILKEKHKMPSLGGVLSAGAAFWNTSLVAKLQENNVKFEIFR